MGIAENIKKRRMELNLSQQELADALGYKSRSTIAKIESGENEVPFSKIPKFARALDTSIEYLKITFFVDVHICSMTDDFNFSYSFVLP